MASSSSAKKVARVAAKSGSGTPLGGSQPGQRNWMFAAAIVVIVALGIGIVAFAREKNEGVPENTVSPKANLSDGTPYDHWHAAFGISVCGTEVAPLQDGLTDPLGIHTHADGLIHIHPFSIRAAGKRATMDKFFGQVGFEVTDDGFKLPAGMTIGEDEGSGDTVREGETTCQGEAGELVLAKWTSAISAAGTEPDEIIRGDFGSVVFEEDLAAYTLAFVAEGDEGSIEPPASAADIINLGAQDGETPQPTGTLPEDDPSATEPTEAPATEPATTEPTGTEASTSEAPPTTAGDGG